MSTDACIANTFFDTPPEHNVTFYDIGTNPMDPIEPGKFEQLDHVVVDSKWLSNIQHIWSDRTRALQSHHFVCVVDLNIVIPIVERARRPPRYDWKSLQSEPIAKKYVDGFINNFGKKHICHSLQNKATTIAQCMMDSASDHVPLLSATPHRPWISSRTLFLIEQRNAARAQGNREDIKDLNKQVQVAARADKKHWLDEAIEHGGWQTVRSLRKIQTRHGRLRDKHGDLVDAEKKAETMADYLQEEQWKLYEGPEQLHDVENHAAHLHINTGPVTLEEVRRAVKVLRVQRAAGNDGVPPDLWQVLWSNNYALDIIRELCDSCW